MWQKLWGSSDFVLIWCTGGRYTANSFQGWSKLHRAEVQIWAQWQTSIIQWQSKKGWEHIVWEGLVNVFVVLSLFRQCSAVVKENLPDIAGHSQSKWILGLVVTSYGFFFPSPSCMSRLVACQELELETFEAARTNVFVVAWVSRLVCVASVKQKTQEVLCVWKHSNRNILNNRTPVFLPKWRR